MRTDSGITLSSTSKATSWKLFLIEIFIELIVDSQAVLRNTKRFWMSTSQLFLVSNILQLQYYTGTRIWHCYDPLILFRFPQFDFYSCTFNSILFSHMAWVHMAITMLVFQTFPSLQGSLVSLLCNHNHSLIPVSSTVIRLFCIYSAEVSTDIRLFWLSNLGWLSVVCRVFWHIAFYYLFEYEALS